MQVKDPDGEAEPTIQTMQQEQGYESTEATEDETHSEQVEQPVPRKEKRRGSGRTHG